MDFNKILRLPSYLYLLAQHKIEVKKYERDIIHEYKRLYFPQKTIEMLKLKLHRVYHSHSKQAPTSIERKLIDNIQKKRKLANQNNITRTKAYLDFYNNHPEIHWSLLAHLVSRNGGWNMTDLKGSLLSPFLTSERTSDFFLFLERANAYIFYDAYPQLLLYEASKKEKKNYFHLLRYFSVSTFMKPFWDHFYALKDSKLLTVALIINEQHYIQKRVIEHPFFKQKVTKTMLFQAQDAFQFTHVTFPYVVSHNKIKLTGISVQDFTDITQRILIGKQLYMQLFGISPLTQHIKAFTTIDHTGSREDFWPTVFSKDKKAVAEKENFFLSKKRKPFIYSPALEDVWGLIHHATPSKEDWYTPESHAFVYFSSIEQPGFHDISETYYKQLLKLSTITDLKQLLP
ncbi:DUF2515 family protein [Alkalihalobacterium bogoriense]|uniref:DUF2515 family protein n=1 Tax=Alkalihalobacterium bogoriense TaxID=246272 RepID=UPI0006859D11|nr:DUF2515 family protein [Alkalihalobacterium bogoriense]